MPYKPLGSLNLRLRDPKGLAGIKSSAAGGTPGLGGHYSFSKNALAGLLILLFPAYKSLIYLGKTKKINQNNNDKYMTEFIFVHAHHYSMVLSQLQLFDLMIMFLYVYIYVYL